MLFTWTGNPWVDKNRKEGLKYERKREKFLVIMWAIL